MKIYLFSLPFILKTKVAMLKESLIERNFMGLRNDLNIVTNLKVG